MKINTITLLTELAQELNIDIATPLDDKLIVLTKNNIKKYIVDYRWPTCNTSIERIVNNKMMSTIVLINEGIPCLDMTTFSQKDELSLFQSTFEDIHLSKKQKEKAYLQKYTDKAEEYGYPIVCKYNTGSNGSGVFKCNNKEELEATLRMALKINKGVAISPFYEIESEYRVTVLNGVAELIYSKQRPTVIGDGNTPLLTLIKNKYPNRPIDTLLMDPTYIVPEDEEILMSWKHNLSLGASASIITDETLVDALSNLALQATSAIDINFASVDIIKINGEYKIMELNAGIIPEMFTEQGDNERTIFKNIFRKALINLFNL